MGHQMVQVQGWLGVPVFYWHQPRKRLSPPRATVKPGREPVLALALEMRLCTRSHRTEL